MKLTRRLTAIAAAITTAAAAFTGTTATAQDEAPRPVVDFNTLSESPVVTNNGLSWDTPTPGMSIESSGMFCTASFFAADEDTNAPVMVTAGHCVQEAPFSWGNGINQRLGQASTYTSPDTPEAAPGLNDYAVVPLSLNQANLSPRIADTYDVVMVLDPEDLEEGMELCKFGMRTQETCGDYIGQDEDGYLRSAIYSKEGDSGSPVFVKLGGNQVALVGILSANHGDSALMASVPVSNILKHERLLLNGEYGYLPEDGL